jgi:glycerol-3-phosphate dehydrogenase
LAALKPALNFDNLPLLIFVNKGIEASTQCMTLEIIADELGPEVAKAATFLVSKSAAHRRSLDDSDLTPSPDRRSQKKVRFETEHIKRLTKDFAVVRRQPTSVSIASLTLERAQKAAEVFHQPWFRWYALLCV